MTYITSEEVYSKTGITSEQVSDNDVKFLIASVEADVDRFTNTTYWVLRTGGTTTSATDNTLTDDTKSFGINNYSEHYIEIISGTGSGQVRKIVSNTSTVITVNNDWDTNPDATSDYKIFYTGDDAYVEEVADGNKADTIFLHKYPLVALESSVVNETAFDISDFHVYKHLGKLKLKKSSGVTRFDAVEPQNQQFNYYYGVKTLPHYVKSLALTYAAIKVLSAQMGTTHNIPSTYSLPEGSITIGQAYINIKGTWDTLQKEKTFLESIVTRYPVFA